MDVIGGWYERILPCREEDILRRVEDVSPLLRWDVSFRALDKTTADFRPAVVLALRVEVMLILPLLCEGVRNTPVAASTSCDAVRTVSAMPTTSRSAPDADITVDQTCCWISVGEVKSSR